MSWQACLSDSAAELVQLGYGVSGRVYVEQTDSTASGHQAFQSFDIDHELIAHHSSDPEHYYPGMK
jgi:hypothetical protein